MFLYTNNHPFPPQIFAPSNPLSFILYPRNRAEPIIRNKEKKIQRQREIQKSRKVERKGMRNGELCTVVGDLRVSALIEFCTGTLMEERETVERQRDGLAEGCQIFESGEGSSGDSKRRRVVGSAKLSGAGIRS